MRFIFYYLFQSVFFIGLFLSSLSAAQAQDSLRAYTLEDIYQRVYQSNPSLMAAREALKERSEIYPQARSGWLPSINAETSVFGTRIENSNFNNADGTITKDFTVSVNQPIWRGGRTFAETKRANDLIEVANAILQQAEQDIFLDTARAYINVLRDRELLVLFKQNEKLLLKELESVKERQYIGDITTTDVQQVQVRLLRANADSLQASSNLDISNAQFKALSDMKPPAKLIVPTTNIQPDINLNNMIMNAKQYNPAVTIAAFEHKASAHQIDAIFGEMLPQVSAFTSYNFQLDPQPGIVDQSENQTLGIRATMALYEGGSTRSRRREAKYASKRKKYEMDDIQNQLTKDVIIHWRRYQTSQALVVSREEEVKVANNALAGVREEAKMGQRSIVNILDADEELIDAKTALTRAKYDHFLTYYTLLNSVGTSPIK